jgi:hypothetical protein
VVVRVPLLDEDDRLLLFRGRRSRDGLTETEAVDLTAWR